MYEKVPMFTILQEISLKLSMKQSIARLIKLIRFRKYSTKVLIQSWGYLSTACFMLYLKLTRKLWILFDIYWKWCLKWILYSNLKSCSRSNCCDGYPSSKTAACCSYGSSNIQSSSSSSSSSNLWFLWIILSYTTFLKFYNNLLKSFYLQSTYR